MVLPEDILRIIYMYRNHLVLRSLHREIEKAYWVHQQYVSHLINAMYETSQLEFTRLMSVEDLLHLDWFRNGFLRRRKFRGVPWWTKTYWVDHMPSIVRAREDCTTNSLTEEIIFGTCAGHWSVFAFEDESSRQEHQNRVSRKVNDALALFGNKRDWFPLPCTPGVIPKSELKALIRRNVPLREFQKARDKHFSDPKQVKIKKMRSQKLDRDHLYSGEAYWFKQWWDTYILKPQLRVELSPN